MIKGNFRLGTTVAVSALLALSACDEFDYDLRGVTGGFSTADAARSASADRPLPDNRGIISYPGYQVALANTGDTLTDVATRIGVDVQALASYNGLPVDAPLRPGEIIALPTRVAEPSEATGAIGTGPIQPASVDVTAIAGQAIETAPAPAAKPAPAKSAKAATQVGEEPRRHKVKPGETAYSIARLYNVRVRDLGEWNGLGPRYTVRTGQFLLIPVAKGEAPARPSQNTEPGQGTPTPVPPSAKKPLPAEKTPAKAAEPAAKVEADLGPKTKPDAGGQLAVPVQGTIIRDFTRGRNENMNIQAAPGTPVNAAADGSVAAITESAAGVPILVIRHDGNLTTVYANITGIAVKKGDKVSRGQPIAKLRDGNQNFLHFEVRKGFESVDPNDYF